MKEELNAIMNAEGDFKQFRYLGFECFAKRGPVGAWCGYVKIPKSHPVFGEDCDSIDIDVHGGLSFSDIALPNYPSETGWYIGFDCAHAGDLCPSMLDYFYLDNDVYRTLEYVETELKKVVEQLFNIDLTIKSYKEEN